MIQPSDAFMFVLSMNVLCLARQIMQEARLWALVGFRGLQALLERAGCSRLKALIALQLFSD